VQTEATSLKKRLHLLKFEEMKNRIFKVIGITELLCEICDKPLDRRESMLREVKISSSEDYENLLLRSKIYDNAEVDLENGRIYFYDHDYPGDVHPSCVEKL